MTCLAVTTDTCVYIRHTISPKKQPKHKPYRQAPECVTKEGAGINPGAGAGARTGTGVATGKGICMGIGIGREMGSDSGVADMRDIVIGIGAAP